MIICVTILGHSLVNCDTTSLGLLSFVVDTKCTNNFWIPVFKYPCNGSGYVRYKQQWFSAGYGCIIAIIFNMNHYVFLQ